MFSAGSKGNIGKKRVKEISVMRTLTDAGKPTLDVESDRKQ